MSIIGSVQTTTFSEILESWNTNISENNEYCPVTLEDAQEGMRTVILYITAHHGKTKQLLYMFDSLLPLLFLEEDKKPQVFKHDQDDSTKSKDVELRTASPIGNDNEGGDIFMKSRDDNAEEDGDDDCDVDDDDDTDEYDPEYLPSEIKPPGQSSTRSPVKKSNQCTVTDTNDDVDMPDNDGSPNDHVKRHVCKVCGKTYQYQRSYERHVEYCKVYYAIANGEDGVACTNSKVDDSSFNDISEEKSTCPICKKSFRKRNTYLHHLKRSPCGLHVNLNTDRQEISAIPEENYTCVVCKKSYGKKTSYKMHLRRTRCGVYARSLDLVNESTQKSASEAWLDPNELLTCTACMKVFPTRRDYLKHVRKTKCKEKVKVEDLSCTICSKTYSYYSAFEHHVREDHQGIRPYKCVQCSESFLSADVIEKHMTAHEHGEGSLCECTICLETFDSVDALRVHVASKPVAHIPKSTHICEVCGYTAKRKSNLDSHRRIHTGELPYKCNFCDKRFRQTVSRQYHIRLHHTGERPHMCNICGKRFAMSTPLKDHIRVHTGERPYVCAVCGKSYRQSRKLVVHKRSHTGERPHVCKECGKTFACRENLRLHLMLHSGEKPYPCKICGKYFRKHYTRTVHMKTHAREVHNFDQQMFITE